MSEISGNQWAIVIFALAVIVVYIARKQFKKIKLGRFMTNDTLIIDARSPGEYSEGHFKGAINIPHDKVAGQVKKIGEKDRKIVVYCASGARSGYAVQVLKDAGYTNVMNAGSLSNMAANQ